MSNHRISQSLSNHIFKKSATNIKTLNTTRYNFRGGIRL